MALQATNVLSSYRIATCFYTLLRQLCRLSGLFRAFRKTHRTFWPRGGSNWNPTFVSVESLLGKIPIDWDDRMHHADSR